tara:strand:- start:798 stop:1361 length:564 start_codon:yes stop_codon:yes gene_type:complete
MPYSPFTGPIPGQSLTGTPKNVPWENPPELVNVEDVAKFHVTKLANQEVLDDMAVLLESGVALTPLVKGLLSAGVMKGMHTIETGMLAEPVIKAFIKAALGSMGTVVKDDNRDPKKASTEREKKRFAILVQAALEKGDAEDPGIAVLEEMNQAITNQDATPMPESEPVATEEPTQAMPSKGLMAKGA